MNESSEKILYLILKKLEEQEELLMLSISALTTKKEVARFFNKSERTIDNWIDNGTFKEGVEYSRNGKGKPEFIPSAILNHRRNMGNIKSSKQNNKNDDSEKIYHPSVKNIIQGLTIG